MRAALHHWTRGFLSWRVSQRVITRRRPILLGIRRGLATRVTLSSSRWTPFTFAPTPAFRGDSLGVDDYPLIPGQFLSTAPAVESANLEVTEVGDLILRQGDIPAYPTDHKPLWAHRVTGSVGVTANGGLG
ncbi:unnamed protein product [Ectocarpus sp. 12 AP-2014]